jgi:hypothetical protein
VYTAKYSIYFARIGARKDDPSGYHRYYFKGIGQMSVLDNHGMIGYPE